MQISAVSHQPCHCQGFVLRLGAIVLASLRFVLLAPLLWTGHQRSLAMTTGHTHSQQKRGASIHHFRHGQFESKSSQSTLYLGRQVLHAGEDQLSEGHLL